MILRDHVGGDGEESGDVAGDGVAQSAHGSVVAARLAGEGSVSRGVDGLEICVRRVGLGGALGGLGPEDLQVGQRGVELLLGKGVTLFELAQDGQDFVAQPALLGVGAQQQADIGEVRGVGMVCHAEHPCSIWVCSGLRRGGAGALEHGVSFHASWKTPGVARARAQAAVLYRPMRAQMHIVGSDPTGRTAGQYARATVSRLRMRTLVTLGVLAVATALLGRLFGLHDARFLGSEIGLLVSMFLISRYVLPLVERRDRGATGEEQVGDLLEELGGAWRVRHDVSLGRGNVDHVLVGPAGVFTVETKSHPGPVRAGQVHGRTLGQAQAQRRAIEQVTGVSVEPLIVFSRAWVDRPLSRRKGVRILPARMLLGYLSRRPVRLSAEEIEKVHGLLGAALADQG